MTLYLIGLGLADQNDISLKALNIIKTCDVLYLENYTSLLQCTKEDLEQLYQKPIQLANRNLTENFEEKIVAEAKTKNVAFLIIGDPFSATTHIELLKHAKEQQTPIEIIHNASILTAIGTTGLQLYKFGRTTSIPFKEKVPHLETPYLVLKENQEKDLHTLLLLDLDPENGQFMTVHEALIILQEIEKRLQEHLITDNMQVVGCARLGHKTQIIKSGSLEHLKSFSFGPPPHCLIIPAKRLHFLEQEMLELWR